ncbi:toxin glutamine deamidase domain-containing protein [Streptomyces sp. NPDC007025]|uniref:toxin glutamine deamidase domain-containing protein n=1 Tax=Streptomyces sp. NPDC007025 TaxID=3364771 RepID=UPI003684B871
MPDLEEIKEWLIEHMGMEWPDADEGQLREGAGHWRHFAEKVSDVTAEVNRQSGRIIHANSGEAVDAYSLFWRRYYHAGRGWLADLEKAARDVASTLDEFANDVENTKERINTQLAIDATAIAAGIGLAYFTGGTSMEAATAVVELSASLTVGLSAAAARIAATTLTSMAFGGLEALTVDLAVAQPLRIATGLQKKVSLKQAQESLLYGSILGAGYGAGMGAAEVRALHGLKDAGNLRWGEGGGGTTLLGDAYKTPKTDDLHKIINPQEGRVNCRGCALAVDSTLEGAPAMAPGKLARGPLKDVEKNFPGKKFRRRSFGNIVKEIQDAGPGARGIVYGADNEGGHVFNVINRDGDVIFLDGQTGHAQHAATWDSYRLLRTR